MTSSVSGMAASIRAATESETFDLAGNSVSTIQTLIRDAFSEPFVLLRDPRGMIRITLVTGAGKLARQKYDPDAAKVVTTTLRELGYEEDRAASCVVECAGSYKLQHDTGKNLKTVVVFPRIKQVDVTGLEAGVTALSTANATTTTTSLLQEGTPQAMIAMASKPVFERMLSTKCPSWSQKKALITVIESLKGTFTQLDERLLQGSQLSDAEQTFYDSVSLDSLEAKEALVRKEMQAQVESGVLTKSELKTLVQQVTDRLDNLEREINDSRDKPKKVEKLQAMKSKLEQRRESLSAIQPKAPHKLRHDAEIQKLLSEVAPLQKLEDDAKGRLMTIKETQMVGRKTEILEQIAQLEESSREWFEDDETFSDRVALTHQAFATKQKLQNKKVNKSTTSGTTVGFKPTTKFITPGMKAAGGGGAWGTKPAPKAKKSPSGVFAAMMMDSDSD